MASPPRLDAYHFYEREWADYRELAEEFEWEIPETFNIASYVCDRWADDGDRVAIFAESGDGDRRTYTFREVRDVTNRLANFLREEGIERGDRVAVNTPQSPETVFAHVAIWKLGAVSVPMSTLFGPDALEYRLADCDVRAVVVDESNVEALRAIEGSVDSLETVLTVGVADREADERDLYSAIDGHSTQFDPVETRAEENAIILYTSGTTGDPKGVVHAHRSLLGFLPTIVTTVGNGEVRPDDVFWSPSEWAWIGTLFLVVFPPLFYGNPTVAYDAGKFDPEEAFELIDRYGVTNFFAPPTALRMMMQVEKPGA
ncbi:MAG TPA: acyl-CoA synthetase, partial [Halobacteriales archaeon]|nr:acyl-CoA synthetase [Halobacteriales archaeon]